jgi:protein-tyrosine phosphatase
MDRENFSHLEALRAGRKSSGAQLALLRSFDPAAPTGAEVPDPYYGGDAGFEEVLDLCEAACRGLLQQIGEGSA